MSKPEKLILTALAALFVAGVAVVLGVLWSIGALRSRRPTPWLGAPK